MKSKIRERSLIVSTALILLCMTIVIGATWALFTDTRTVKNHLQAGDMRLTLLRTRLVTNSLNDDNGYLEETDPDNSVVDFSNENDENVFDIEKGALIVPGSWYEATMKIANNSEYAKSDVAFKYWIEIKLDFTGLNAEQIEALKLDEQLKVTVTTKAGTTEAKATSATLDKCIVVGNELNPIGELAKDTSEDFIVRVEFLDKDTNNDAKRQSLNFDLIVHATQVTTATTGK